MSQTHRSRLHKRGMARDSWPSRAAAGAPILSRRTCARHSIEPASGQPRSGNGAEAHPAIESCGTRNPLHTGWTTARRASSQPATIAAVRPVDRLIALPTPHVPARAWATRGLHAASLSPVASLSPAASLSPGPCRPCPRASRSRPSRAPRARAARTLARTNPRSGRCCGSGRSASLPGCSSCTG